MATLAGIYWLFTLPCVLLIPVIIIACGVSNRSSARKEARFREAFRKKHEHDFDYLDNLYHVK